LLWFKPLYEAVYLLFFGAGFCLFSAGVFAEKLDDYCRA